MLDVIYIKVGMMNKQSYLVNDKLDKIVTLNKQISAFSMSFKACNTDKQSIHQQ